MPRNNLQRMRIEIKRVEKLSLSFFPPPHHAPLPPMPSLLTETWFAFRIKGSFATQSSQKRTSNDATATSAKVPLADLPYSLAR
jgi:hypothetical protein